MQILRYAASSLRKYFVSRLRKYFVFLPNSDISMTFFVYIRECVKHGSSVQDKQDLKTQSFCSHKK